MIRQSRTNGSPGQDLPAWWQTLSSAVLAAALPAVAGACSQISYATRPTAGETVALSAATKRPDMNTLEGRLKLGHSNKQDVLAALGKPSGDGGIFLALDPRPRETWTYYYEEGSIRLSRPPTFETGRTFLFVYFDNDRYDGYMWFSSLR